ncbi:MAG: PIN domain-containing protein [Acidobacteriota bacterium]
MPADAFFDTSVLVYLVAGDPRRSPIAEDLLESGGCVSVHVLNELVAVMRRKLRMPWNLVLETTGLIRALCEPPVPITVEMHDKAVAIAQRFKFHIYDSLVIAAALACRCSVLYSEDMQDGQKVETLRIRNPFRSV